MNTRLIFGGLLLAASTTLFAQSAPAPAAKDGPPSERHAPHSCEKAPDPGKCEAHRKETKEHMSQAREACKGKEGPDRGQCVAAQMCSKASDPAKCQARARERAERRHEKHEQKHEMREKRNAPDAKKN